MACKIDNLVCEAIVTMDEQKTVRQAAELMTKNSVGSLVVTGAGQVVGLFTERDLLTRVVSEGLDPDHLKIKEVCTRDLISIRHDSTCAEAIKKMRKNLCRRLLVYRGDRFLGLVKLPEVAQALAERGSGGNFMLNAIAGITLAVALCVIAMMVFQLPDMVQLAHQIKSR